MLGARPGERLTLRLMDGEGGLPRFAPEMREDVPDAIRGLGDRGSGVFCLLAAPVGEYGGDRAVAPAAQPLADGGGRRLAAVGLQLANDLDDFVCPDARPRHTHPVISYLRNYNSTINMITLSILITRPRGRCRERFEAAGRPLLGSK